jgi:hypothetical protein
MLTPIEVEIVAEAHRENLLRQVAAIPLPEQAAGDRVPMCQRLAEALRIVAGYLDGDEADHGASVTTSVGVSRGRPLAFSRLTPSSASRSPMGPHST